MVISSTNITKSKINYIVISILGIAILTTLVWAGITINRYAKVEKLCREIKAGKTIETSMADGTTAPVFFHNICTIMPTLMARKQRGTEAPLDEGERGESNSWLKIQHSKI